MLTDAGQSLFPAVNEALDLMNTAVDRLHRHDRSGVLTVTTMDSFAATWLVPRLGRFRAAHSEIDVHISTSDDSVDFDRVNVDLAIRYGHGEWPGLSVERLMTEELFPVCAPALRDAGPALATPADLKHHTLLHDDMRADWRMWLMALGETGVDATRGPSYQHSNLVIQAAEQGDGVALARSVLVARALAAGRLVKPFDFALQSNYAYYVVCPKTSLERPKVKAFRGWLLEEARRSQEV
jgi:LysR family glycine cleavage system transcriptional activator